MSLVTNKQRPYHADIFRFHVCKDEKFQIMASKQCDLATNSYHNANYCKRNKNDIKGEEMKWRLDCLSVGMDNQVSTSTCKSLQNIFSAL